MRTQLTDFNFQIYYKLLRGTESISFNIPESGFINILMVGGTGVSTYIVNQKACIIRNKQNIMHLLEKGDHFNWKNICEENIALLLFVPQHMLEDLQIDFNYYRTEFPDGFLTQSDPHLSLICDQFLNFIQQPNNLQKLRIQSLLMEAVARQIEGLYTESQKETVPLHKPHYDKVQMARELIAMDLSKNYTITDLAKSVGTNEQYLKKHFKQYFGKTIMNYATEKKMEHAKELIMTGDYRVSDVARMTGYKHPTHFTSAFKKYFGFIPNSLKYTFLIASEGGQLLLELGGLTCLT